MLGRNVLTISIAAAALAAPSFAQQAQRPMSPPGTTSVTVGGTWGEPNANGVRRYANGKWVEITYNRPILRGRTEVFGKGADYGKAVNDGSPVWRVGANQTTKLTTEATLEIGGKRLAPGAYAVFVDLKEGAWTLILSSQPLQEKYDPNDKTKIWGSYGYDPKFDVVRVPMKMATPQVSIEQFTIAFVDMTAKGGKLAMAWEKTAAVVPFAVVD